MEQHYLKEIEKSIKSSKIINSYLEDYLKDDIDRIIYDYDLDISKMADDEVPHVIGYSFGFSSLLKYKNTIQVIISFFYECSESGIGLECKDVDLTDFINWLNENY